MAAVLVCGDRAVLSHRSAARLWGLRPWSGDPEITVPVEGGARRHGGITVHRSRHLPAEECTTETGIPVTTVARTLVDLAGIVPPHHLRRAVERAEERELFDLRQVLAVIDRRPHVAGVAALRALLADARAHDLPTTRSDPEAALLQLCLDHGLPRPQVNRYDGTDEVDFRWPAHRLVVEVDGWSTHRTRSAFTNDRVRDRAQVRAGLRVVRFTAREVLERPAAVAAELRVLLGLSPTGAAAGAAASGGSSPGPAPRRR
jgi:very-short-patch-repair endonuclease